MIKGQADATATQSNTNNQWEYKLYVPILHVFLWSIALMFNMYAATIFPGLSDTEYKGISILLIFMAFFLEIAILFMDLVLEHKIKVLKIQIWIYKK